MCLEVDLRVFAQCDGVVQEAHDRRHQQVRTCGLSTSNHNPIIRSPPSSHAGALATRPHGIGTLGVGEHGVWCATGAVCLQQPLLHHRVVVTAVRHVLGQHHLPHPWRECVRTCACMVSAHMSTHACSRTPACACGRVSVRARASCTQRHVGAHARAWVCDEGILCGRVTNSAVSTRHRISRGTFIRHSTAYCIDCSTLIPCGMGYLARHGTVSHSVR